jgi:RNA 2',3'-cyclic 3'-phosphodiesterase
MRLFIGIELPARLQEAAARASESFDERLSRDAPQVALRWVRPPNLHITLWFLGEVDEGRAQRISEELRPQFRIPAFTLRVGATGAFPPSGPPRALWLGIRDGVEPLVAIHRELNVRLGRLGFEPERRAYSPHLTIARFKDISRADVAIVRRLITQAADDVGACRIDAVTLFRSRTSPKGAQYEPLLRVPLG